MHLNKVQLGPAVSGSCSEGVKVEAWVASEQSFPICRIQHRPFCLMFNHNELINGVRAPWGCNTSYTVHFLLRLPTELLCRWNSFWERFWLQHQNHCCQKEAYALSAHNLSHCNQGVLECIRLQCSCHWCRSDSARINKPHQLTFQSWWNDIVGSIHFNASTHVVIAEWIKNTTSDRYWIVS